MSTKQVTTHCAADCKVAQLQITNMDHYSAAHAMHSILT